MKKILITGAAGYLGSNLVRSLTNLQDLLVFATDISKDKIPCGANIKAMTNDELFQLETLAVDVIIHCAFARGNDISGLVSALYFNERLIEKLKNFQHDAIVNISSQGLYKPLSAGELAREDGVIEPFDMYALAKFAQERLLTSNFGSEVTNIRMASLSANARFIVFFVDSVIRGNDITVSAPNQYVSILDVRDAVSAIIKVAGLPKAKRKPVYNLGTGKQYSILQIADLVNKIGGEKGYSPININVSDGGKSFAVGMDPALLKRDTGWEAVVQIEEMIDNIFEQRKGEVL